MILLTNRIYYLECESSLPDGRMTIRLFEYDVPIMKVQEYTLDDFE